MSDKTKQLTIEEARYRQRQRTEDNKTKWTPGPSDLPTMHLRHGDQQMLPCGCVMECEPRTTAPAVWYCPIHKAAPEMAEALRAVMAWAQTPGEHGGNPYCKDFVRKAERALVLADKED